MIKILFVCHGNICRSPMAELLFNKHVKELGLEQQFMASSVATSSEEVGAPVYPPVAKILNSIGIDCSGKTATKIKAQDIEEYDYLIAMDENNIRNINSLFPKTKNMKIHKLLQFVNSQRDVEDPWYTRDFQGCYKEVSEATLALIKYLQEHESA